MSIVFGVVRMDGTPFEDVPIVEHINRYIVDIPDLEEQNVVSDCYSFDMKTRKLPTRLFVVQTAEVSSPLFNLVLAFFHDKQERLRTDVVYVKAPTQGYTTATLKANEDELMAIVCRFCESIGVQHLIDQGTMSTGNMFLQFAAQLPENIPESFRKGGVFSSEEEITAIVKEFNQGDR